MSFDGRVAIVTGGGVGIGRAIAVELARRGARVVVNYLHSEAAAQAVADGIAAAGGAAVAARADVRDAGAVEGLVALALERFGRLDFLVNNAGIVRRGGLAEVTEEMWDEVLDVNLKGVFLCSRAAAPPMLAAGGGAILNVASIRGVAGSKRSPHYAAAKAGVIALTKSLALELAPAVRVNCVAPGYVDTRVQAHLPAEKRAEILAATPLGRMPAPEDVAAAAVFLLSAGAALITGQTLVVDGGLVLARGGSG